MDDIIPSDFHDGEDFEEDRWYKGPLKIILGIGLGILVIMMIVPLYAVKLDPSPQGVPTLSDVVGEDFDGGNVSIYGGNYGEYVTLVDGSDARVKLVADKIVGRSCESGQRVCFAKALFYFVRDEFDYVNDPLAYDYVKSAPLSLESTIGDCDDSSILIANFLDSIGIESRFVFVSGHVWVQAKIPEALDRYKEDGWINLDGTCQYCEFGEIGLPYVEMERRYV
jgi:hypothetical protein